MAWNPNQDHGKPRGRRVTQAGLAAGLLGVSAIAMGMVWPSGHVLVSAQDTDGVPESTEPTQPVGDPPAAQSALGDDIYSRVMRLRRDAGLTNHDLAALGLSQEVSEAVLSRLADWVIAHHAALIQAGNAVLDAKRQLAERERAVRIGTGGEHIYDDIDTDRESLVAAEAAYLALCDQGVMSALSAAPSAARDRWADTAAFRATAAGEALPIEVRYLSSMSEARANELRDSLSIQEGLADALTSYELGSVEEVRGQIAEHLPGVIAAEQSALPLPPELQEDEAGMWPGEDDDAGGVSGGG